MIMTNSLPVIAHFIDTQNKGGAEVTMMDLVIYQHRTGRNVIVFHHHNKYIADKCQQLDIKTASIPAHKHYKRTYTLPLYAVALARKLKQYDVDILHSHLFGPATANALACWLTNIRHIATLHDVYMIEDKPIRAKLLQLSCKLGTKLVCVSKDMEKFYRQRLNLDKGELKTIYNASEVNTAPSGENRSALLKLYDLDPDKIVISTIGRLVPLKRIDWIITALSSLDKNLLANVKLVVIGDGPEKKPLIALAEEILPGKAVFTGEITNVSDLLNLSDIYVQFSNTEGLSRSIIEALSCRLPCIVSDVGGNREIVINGCNGYLLDSLDHQNLVESLATLIKNGSNRTEMGKASFNHFKECFNFGHFQTEYVRLYQNNDNKK
jgi:glycosyltransferase involved in cell wall biosynthesis